MRTGVRRIESGNQFNHLFPLPKGENIRIKKRANLEDTVVLMKKGINKTLSDTRKVANLLRSGNTKQTLANVWNFCFKHLQYRRDEENIEQVRSPARTWSDRKQGVDCDCMTVFIGSILLNLGIPFVIRLSRNSLEATGFEHVYPVAITNQGKVIMDCVVHQFNFEAPYLEIKDINMELQYLNGFEDDDFDDEVDGFDGYDDEFDEYDDLEGLDGKQKRQEKKAARKAKRAEKGPLKERIKKGIQKTLHVVNKLNPATALLRAGVLVSLKTNLFNVAGRLRYTYWTDEQAQKNNVDMPKFQKLKQIRQKIEKVFFGAGGKPENMKKAILTGRGNRNKAVSVNGLGYVPIYDDSNLRSIIGSDMYSDEFDSVKHPSGINGLGSISAGAAVAAASGIIGTIAGLIKKLSGIFKKGSPQEQQDILAENTAGTIGEKNDSYSKEEIGDYLDAAKGALAPESATSSSSAASFTEDDTLPVPTTTAVAVPAKQEVTTEQVDLTELDDNQVVAKSAADTGSTPKSTPGGMWKWIQEHPMTTVGIAAAVIGGTVLAIRAYRKSKGKTGQSKTVNGLDGLDGVRRKKRPTSRTTTTKRKTTKRKKPGVKRHTGVRKVKLL
ncbi:hypothetical protein D3C87_22710 [compost metagenome]